MKKLVLTSACAVAFAGAAFAQGTVTWSTISPGAFTAVTNTTASSFISGGAALQGGTSGAAGTATVGYYYELLYNASATSAPTTLAGLDGWSDTGLEGENNVASPGRAVVLNSTTSATVPFTAATEIMIVGWSSNLGTTWSAASTVLNSQSALASVIGTAFFGESSVASFTPFPSGSNPGATAVGTSAGEIKSLATPLYVVSAPEPTTIALGAMGAASLLALRRKKA